MLVIIVWLTLMFFVFWRLTESPAQRQARRNNKIQKRQALQKEFDEKWNHVPAFDKFMFYFIIFNVIVLILIWVGHLIYPIFIA